MHDVAPVHLFEAPREHAQKAARRRLVDAAAAAAPLRGQELGEVAAIAVLEDEVVRGDGAAVGVML